MDNGANQNRVDRRKKPRIYEPFPVKVRGVDASGEVFNIDAVVSNLSTGGVYFQLPQFVEPGAKLFVLIKMSTARSETGSVPRVAARGLVLRTEPKLEGVCGLAVVFTSYRFL